MLWRSSALLEQARSPDALSESDERLRRIAFGDRRCFNNQNRAPSAERRDAQLRIEQSQCVPRLRRIVARGNRSLPAPYPLDTTEHSAYTVRQASPRFPTERQKTACRGACGSAGESTRRTPLRSPVGGSARSTFSL